MGIIDRVFGWLLVLGVLGHAMGCLRIYAHSPELLLWSESATLAGLLLAAINLVRAARPDDRMLASVSFAGCLGWLVMVIFFGKLVGNFFDFRPLIFGIITLVLAGMSLRTALGKA